MTVDLTAPRAIPLPGEFFKGLTIQIPGRFEGMGSRQLTLEMMRLQNNEEWFDTQLRGRREGEEPTVVVTRYALQEGTAIEASMTPQAFLDIDMEDVKKQLREIHANQKSEPGTN